MKLSEEQLSLLWLSSAEVSAHTFCKLKEKFESAEAIRREFIKSPDLFRKGTREKLTGVMHTEALEQMAQELEEKNVHLLFQEDEAYPELLSQIPDPPYLLYYAGKLSAFNQPMVAMVGSRRASSYGREIAGCIAEELARAGVTVVSGLAYGIDAASHWGALKTNGVTIGVMGSGINRPYPAEHLELMRKIAGGKGLVISEYPLNAEPSKYHFPYRNRIISGLSLGVVYVEGKIKGGGMHTVNAALDQSREVFAVPGQVGTVGAEGPNQLIREGARLVTSGEDILIDLGLKELTVSPPAPKTTNKKVDDHSLSLNSTQNAIITLLRVEALGSQAIAARLGLPEEDILTELGIMEITGDIQREAGNMFRLPLQNTRRI